MNVRWLIFAPVLAVPTPERAETLVERRRYLVEGLGACANCHRPKGLRRRISLRRPVGHGVWGEPDRRSRDGPWQADYRCGDAGHRQRDQAHRRHPEPVDAVAVLRRAGHRRGRERPRRVSPHARRPAVMEDRLWILALQGCRQRPAA
jgi:hypothetical protein